MLPYRYLVPVSFFIATLTPQAGAEISRCLQADGIPQFTNQPCPEGVPAEPVVLVENTPLDSSTVRANMERYAARKAEREPTGPHVVLITDAYGEERNARLSGAGEQDKKKKKSSGKSKKKKKTKKKEKTE